MPVFGNFFRPFCAANRSFPRRSQDEGFRIDRQHRHRCIREADCSEPGKAQQSVASAGDTGGLLEQRLSKSATLKKFPTTKIKPSRGVYRCAFGLDIAARKFHSPELTPANHPQPTPHWRRKII
jgi:hypothetical protein